MNHLMDDHVLQLLLVQIIHPGEMQGKVLVCRLPMIVFLDLVSQLAKIVLGMTDSDSRQGEFPVEAEVVVSVENALYVNDGDLHECDGLVVRLYTILQS